jgi:hypothetical protein
MSLNIAIMDKLQILITRLNDDLSTGNKSVKLDDMFSTFEMVEDTSFGDFIERLETSNESEQEELMNQFSSFDEEKKNLLVLIMEVISKMGKIHEHEDSTKQLMWYEKLKGALNEN